MSQPRWSTLVWHCVLKDPQTADSAEFRSLLSEILAMIASYSNPDPTSPPMHVFYQDAHDPAQLVMITGYPSQELNTEADTVYARDFMPRLFQYVTHKSLRQLDKDIGTLPLQDNVLLVSGQEPGTERTGGWDVWPQTAQGRRILGEAADTEKVWVQVTPWDGHRTEEPQPTAREKFYLRKFVA
ncbi:uncharacterized protein N7459_004571 [Penicillium hispanicum]|uniref:uncharacterized protein n=1 Tax=Penicillium hispanicum TaxID=1080232 RepID=UPI00253FBCBD|nr:uncharacterized protein N7459_004571 [Penicillium hispanicum]KAJ5584771.1 hypothetical protein N7459_004571 [Penicillium hispanicum]